MSLRMSQEEFDAMQRKRAKPSESIAVLPWDKPKRREMNKLETAYAQRLEAQKACGEIIWWAFEPIRLRLADGAWYKPDFAVLRDCLEFHETKGFMREAANVRLKVASDLYRQFRFVLVKKVKGEFIQRIV